MLNGRTPPPALSTLEALQALIPARYPVEMWQHYLALQDGCALFREWASLPVPVSTTQLAACYKPYLMPNHTKSGFEDAWLDTELLEEAVDRVIPWNPEFVYLGTITADTRSCTHALRKMDKDKTHTMFGLIVNTSSDAGSKGGVHWVAVFVDRPKREIEYFDPFGNPPPNISLTDLQTTNQVVSEIPDSKVMHVRGLMVELQKRLAFENKIRYAATNHQAKDHSQCGMYSLWFLSQRQTRLLKEIDAERVGPARMIELRHQWFLKPPDFLYCKTKTNHS
jgi:hypothetical protein